MRIFILKKSLSDIKTPIVKKAYETEATTVRALIGEMVTRNYASCRPRATLADCIQTAADDFADGCIYIVNATQDVKYAGLDQELHLRDGDELMLIKLKFVRGILW